MWGSDPLNSLTGLLSHAMLLKAIRKSQPTWYQKKLSDCAPEAVGGIYKVCKKSWKQSNWHSNSLILQSFNREVCSFSHSKTHFHLPRLTFSWLHFETQLLIQQAQFFLPSLYPFLIGSHCLIISLKLMEKEAFIILLRSEGLKVPFLVPWFVLHDQWPALQPFPSSCWCLSLVCYLHLSSITLELECCISLYFLQEAENYSWSIQQWSNTSIFLHRVSSLYSSNNTFLCCLFRWSHSDAEG